MKKDAIIQGFIEAWKPVFEAYPTLTRLPVYAWGRYYKYECAGEAFESYGDEGVSSFGPNFNYDSKFDWELLKEIDNTHNVPGGNMWTGEWGDFLPDREDMVKHWRFDSRGGMCIVIVRNGDDFSVEALECDSGE